MAKREQFVTDEQWAKIEPLLPKRKVSKRGGRPAVSDREYLEGIWVLEAGLVGKTYLIGIGRIRRAGDDWCIGKARTFSWPSGTHSLMNSTKRGSLTGSRSSSMPAFRLQKKGRRRGSDQTWKRYKVVGGGRWQRSSPCMPDRVWSNC